MADVVKFYPKDAASSADHVLEQAVGEYDQLLIIGINKAGDMEVRGTTGLSNGDTIYLLEKFKHDLLSGCWDEDD